MSKKILSAWISFALSSMLFVGAAQKGDRKLDILEEDGRGMNAVHYRKRKGRKRELKSDQSWNLKNLAMKYPVASVVSSFFLGGAGGAVGYFAFDSFCKKYNKHNSAGEYRSPEELIDDWRESIGEDPDGCSTIGLCLKGVAHLDAVNEEFAKSKEGVAVLSKLFSLKSRGEISGKSRQFDRYAEICFDGDSLPKCRRGSSEYLELSYCEGVLIRSVCAFFDERFGIRPRAVERGIFGPAYFNFAFFVDNNVSYEEIDKAVVSNGNSTFEKVISTHVPTFVNNLTCNFVLYKKK